MDCILRLTAFLLVLCGFILAPPRSGHGAPGQAGPARIVINIPSRTLTLFLGEKVYKTYPVGVGQRRWPTPIGNWKILEKVVNPVWGYPLDFDRGGKRPPTPPGPRNPLGTRWMGFTPQQHGIHGTNRPDTVGKVISHGCVRMYIRDSEELFPLVSVGTPVQVRHDTVAVRLDRARGYVLAAAYADVYRRGKPTRKHVETALMSQGAEARLSDERLRALFSRADGQFRVVGWLGSKKPAETAAPVAGTQEEKSE